MMKNKIFFEEIIFMLCAISIFFNSHIVSADWHIETVDSNFNVGLISSLALDSNGSPHISYCDFTNHFLKYASFNGLSWYIETLDYSSPHNSLALDSNDSPHISYMDSIGCLRYFSRTAIETVDCPTGKVGLYNSIALDSINNPHISYQDELYYDTKYASYNGVTWVVEWVTLSSDVFDGFNTSLKLDSNDNPHISFRGTSSSGMSLMYAAYNGISWAIDSIDSNGSADSLALDSNNNPHISYTDFNSDEIDELKYAVYNGNSWDIEIVDSVGYQSSLALDANDRPHISYMDSVGCLKYASYNGSSWEIETVDSYGGGYTSLTLDSYDRPHISYYDAINADLKYAWLSPDTDTDYDGVIDGLDNCPDQYNPGQEDSYPPQGNSIGNACECEGNFSCSADHDVDGTDAFTFKTDFGRSTILHPCIAGDTCNGDFSCDGDVDGTDAFLFKSDFGRSSILNPCPACASGVEWCAY